MFIPRLRPRIGRVYVLTRSEALARALEPVLAAHGRAAVRADGWEQLRAMYLDAPPTSLFIADPFAAGAGATGVDPELRRFLTDFPACALIAPAAVNEHTLSAVRELRARGVADVLELPAGLDEGMAARLRETAERRIDRPLEGLALLESPATRGFLSAAGVVIARTGDPPRVAGALRVSEAELRAFCERRALPEPDRLLDWVRLVYTSELLDEPGRPPAAAARAFGYADEAEMDAAALRLVGLPAGELRALGAYRLVASGLRNELLAVRREAENRRGER